MKSINRVLGRAILIFGFFIVICLVIGSGNVRAAENENFTITAAENSVNSSAWNLRYAESKNAFTITVSDKNGEKVYNVHNKFFEVAYIMNKTGFGARMVKPGKAQVPFQILEKIINFDELNNQKIISSEQVSNESALNLIAGFLPDLINANYKHLLH